MNIIKIFCIITCIFLSIKIKAQTASFVYTVNPNGDVTFSNTSVPSPTAPSAVYYWDTGNGQTYFTSSLSQTVSSHFGNGTYSITLKMTLPDQTYEIAAENITVSIVGCPLMASAQVSSSAPGSPTVTFSSVSTGTTTFFTTYAWNFGDGSSYTSVLPDTTHVYPGLGVYGYTLIATNNATCSSAFQVSPQQAYIGATHICGYTPFLQDSIGVAGDVTIKVKNLGNGTPGNTFGFFSQILSDDLYNGWPIGTNYARHIFFNGVHTIDLQVNTGSCIFTDQVTFTITDNPCTANAAYTYTAGNGGVVQFSKSTPDSPKTSYTWDFGDGSRSFSPNPTHTYASAGNFTATLFSYDTTYASLLVNPMDYYINTQNPCGDVNTTNINITGIPCVADAGFAVNQTTMPYTYWIRPSYPYNVSRAIWYWGDGGSDTLSSSIYTAHDYAVAGNYNICLTITTTCGAVDSFCVSHYMSKGTAGDMVKVIVQRPEIVTSIENNVTSVIPFDLYPNPAQGLLNIRTNTDLRIEDVDVFDLVGKSLYTSHSPQSNDGLQQIDLRHLNNGIYFIRLKSSAGTVSAKFIIAK